MNEYNLLHSIGNTPVVKLKKFSTAKVQILAKLEGANPGGSIKDRVGLYMINDAIRKGLLIKGKVIIEATSGNTGIAISMLSAYYGYKYVAVMPESVSIERRKLIRSYGSEIILTDGTKGTNYAIKLTRDLMRESPDAYIHLDQFNNPLNVLAHYESTGLEIIDAIPEITHFVSGMGTGGTLMGVGKRLKERKSDIQIIGVEPVPFSSIQGLRNMREYTPGIFSERSLDKKLQLLDDEIAYGYAREIARTEGLSVGMSSGAALWGALEVAKTIKEGVIVTIFPDRGDRYISTGLFNV